MKKSPTAFDLIPTGAPADAPLGGKFEGWVIVLDGACTVECEGETPHGAVYGAKAKADMEGYFLSQVDDGFSEGVAYVAPDGRRWTWSPGRKYPGKPSLDFEATWLPPQ